jgi:molybdopterin-guanine dinucleotide biosynthesis protein A
MSEASDSMQTSLLGNVTGALLLGGESTRMGCEKAQLQWKGESWSTRAARLLADLFTETLLVGGHPDDEAPGRRVADPPGPSCALRGLIGALEAATSPRVLAVATDLPFLCSDLLLALCAWPEREVVVPFDEHGDHPLCAIYEREPCLRMARANFASDRLSLRELLAQADCNRVTIAQLGLSDLGSALFTNINTPDELALLEVG